MSVDNFPAFSIAQKCLYFMEMFCIVKLKENSCVKPPGSDVYYFLTWNFFDDLFNMFLSCLLMHFSASLRSKFRHFCRKSTILFRICTHTTIEVHKVCSFHFVVLLSSLFIIPFIFCVLVFFLNLICWQFFHLIVNFKEIMFGYTFDCYYLYYFIYFHF